MKYAFILFLGLVACQSNEKKEIIPVVETTVTEKLAETTIENFEEKIVETIEDKEKNFEPNYSTIPPDLDYPFDVLTAFIYDNSGSPTNVRKTPDGDILIQLPNDDSYEYEFDIVDKKDKWFKVTYFALDDKFIKLPVDGGWVHGSVVTFSTRNYGDEEIPVYQFANSNNQINSINTEIQIHLLDYHDFEGDIDFVKITWTAFKVKYEGWVETKWLCGNPYTTCS